MNVLNSPPLSLGKNRVSALIGATVLLVLFAGIIYMIFGERKYVIGYVNPNPEEKEGAPGFLRNMPRYGYIEGKNVAYIKNESRDRESIEQALREMVAKRVDLIFTMTTPAAKMAKDIVQDTDIPIVFIMYDAVGTGIVKSLVDHDNNITGVQIHGSTPKALEWLSLISPHARHIFVPVSFDTGAAKQSLEKLRQGCTQAGLKLSVAEVKTPEELNLSLSSMPGDIDAVFLLHSWLVGSHVDKVIEEANKRGIPVVSAGHVDYQHGLVMSFAATDDSAGNQAARLAHKILKGTPPGHLPVENADIFLGINLRTARNAGIEIPDTVLKQADYIIR